MNSYPITTPFGWVDGYPLNQDASHPGQGFHNGIDYGCPMGTPVIVNGVVIGISNNTGASTGPHLHVGKWVAGSVEDPGVGNGFTFNSAVVYDTGYDGVNGNYVRINGDGALWCYLHLQTTLVTQGQTLQGGDDMASQADLDLANYKLQQSEDALRVREQQATDMQAQIDLLNYKFSQSEHALRSRELQATDLQNQINSLQEQLTTAKNQANPVPAAPTPSTDPLPSSNPSSVGDTTPDSGISKLINSLKSIFGIK